MYKPHPQLSGMILEKDFQKSTLVEKAGRICNDINKLINSQNTYSLWLTTVVFIAKAKTMNFSENRAQAQENDGKR